MARNYMSADFLSDAEIAEISEWLGVRIEVLKFAIEMERNLRKNDHKGKTGWKDGSPFSTKSNLVSKLAEEYMELQDAVTCYDTVANENDVRSEAADLGNICMMLADNYGGLTAGTKFILEPEAVD